jgi:tetratricopeptide (TPR) repeat protein
MTSLSEPETPVSPSATIDYFISRRGAAAAVAQEVATVLKDAGYSALVQDFDFRPGANFVAAMHKALKQARHLIVLLTRDYEASDFTSIELMSFLAAAIRAKGERRLVILRVEDCQPEGILAGIVFGDLVGVTDPEERRMRILAAAEGRTPATPRRPRIFENVPLRDFNFTGREELLSRLHALLQDRNQLSALGPVAVHGLGGLGKTSLAAQYVHRYAENYAGVWWVPAEQRTVLISHLAMHASKLEGQLAAERDQERAAKLGLARLSDFKTPFLLVYDNAKAPETVRDLVPSTGVRVLITTRCPDWGGQAVEVGLDVLRLEDATDFLQKRAARNDVPSARNLAVALGCLPLALDHAGAYCRMTAMSFDAYRDKIDTLVARVPKGASYPRSVATTFELAIANAVARCPAAELVIAVLAQCAPELIPVSLVEAAIEGEVDRWEAVRELTEASLVKLDPFEDGSPALQVHRIVQAVGRSRSQAKGLEQRATRCIVTWLSELYPKDGFKNAQSWSLCAQLTPHLLVQDKERSRGLNERREWPDILSRAGSYFQGRASYAQAEALFREALMIRARTLGRSHPVTARSMNILAGLLRDRGYLMRAKPLYERALAINERSFREHPETARSLNNLGRLLQDLGNFEQARACSERALAIYEATRGEHPHTARTLVNLAGLLRDMGDPAGARAKYERALAIREKVLGLEHLDTALSLDNLARLFQSQRDFAQAHMLYLRGLAIREKLGPEHPETARSFNNLASLLKDQGDHAGARQLYEQALSIRETRLGPEHPLTARSLSNLARLLEAKSDVAGARALFERALAIWEIISGPEHPETAKSLGNLARVLEAEGHLEQALALRGRAEAIRDKLLREEPDLEALLGPI